MERERGTGGTRGGGDVVDGSERTGGAGKGEARHRAEEGTAATTTDSIDLVRSSRNHASLTGARQTSLVEATASSRQQDHDVVASTKAETPTDAHAATTSDKEAPSTNDHGPGPDQHAHVKRSRSRNTAFLEAEIDAYEKILQDLRLERRASAGVSAAVGGENGAVESSSRGGSSSDGGSVYSSDDGGSSSSDDGRGGSVDEDGGVDIETDGEGEGEDDRTVGGTRNDDRGVRGGGSRREAQTTSRSSLGEESGRVSRSLDEEPPPHRSPHRSRREQHISFGVQPTAEASEGQALGQEPLSFLCCNNVKLSPCKGSMNPSPPSLLPSLHDSCMTHGTPP